MKYFANQLLNQLDQQLTNILPLVEEDPIQNCPPAINILMEGYGKLRAAYINQKASKEEEIDFFKNDKPRLTSQIIYFNDLYSIECNRPAASEKAIRKYYAKQLKKLEQFFIDNAAFYRYCRKGDQYRDDTYFLRNQQESKCLADSFLVQIDRSFATSHDYKAAQVLAYERLQDYLARKIRKPAASKSIRHERALKWTGPKVGIIELIYALHTEGAFNHGAAEVREIVQVFSLAFDIDLGQFHRTFHEICNRKYDRTKFLVSLNEGLLRRMDQADEK